MEDDSLVLEIGGIYVAEDVMNILFACDLDKCKGACCATGDASIGAPLTDLELDNIQQNKVKILSLLPQENQDGLAKTGLYERKDVRYFTPSLPKTAQCSYAVKDSGCWSCVIQQNKAQLGFDKPNSCSLFPIREMMTDDFKPLLILEGWDECDPGYERGEREDILVYQALKGGLVQRFGEKFYNALDNFVQSGQLDDYIQANG